MAEMIATRRSKTKERPRISLGDVPEPPDMSFIEIVGRNEAEVEMPKEVTEVDKIVGEEVDVEPVVEKTVEDVKPREPASVMLRSPEPDAPIARLYPSIIRCQSSIENAAEELMESLDMVVENIMKPEAPLEDWQLPEPLPERELMRYYENRVLDDLEDMEEQFLAEAAPQVHPLLELVERWERAVCAMWHARDRIKSEREACGSKAKDLWKVMERSGTKEAKCRDNVTVRRSYNYEEAVYDSAGAGRLELGLLKVARQCIEELCVAQYEAGVGRALVEDYLVRTRSGPFAEVRRCIAVLLQVLRRPLAHASCRGALQDWVVFLGGAIAASGDCGDRLYLLWQLLHAPAGVGEWGATLVQAPRGPGEMDIAVAYLALILASDRRRPRDLLLRAFEPDGAGGGGGGAGIEDSNQWTVVDSEGEEDAAAVGGWSLLRESDLTALLRQVPIKAVFKLALDIDPHRDSANAYDPGRSCHPASLLRLMALCRSLLTLLDRGLDLYDLSRYKTFNKRISRLIKHTVQFLTDHMELVLGTSMNVEYSQYFLDDTRFRLLAQYETVFEVALATLMQHHRHGNWQCLADLPWRMLSPHRKQAVFYRLVDPSLTAAAASLDQMVTCLQCTLEAAQHSEGLYLLTALSNLAMECRPAIALEYRLIANVTNVLFQTCYVLPVTRTAFSKLGRELLSTVCLQHPQALSVILEAVKLWHPSIGQMGLFLFRELPFCLLMPSDAEFKLLSGWLLDSAPASVCNQLARHVCSNLNWGFANTEETVLYLPLYLHQRMADLLVVSYKRHSADTKSGQWMLESMRLVTSLWWNQDSLQEQSFHLWCLGMAIRMRLHVTSRPRVFDPVSLQVWPTAASPDWDQALADAHQDKCAHPVAMYMAVVARPQSKPTEAASLRVLQNLVTRHQQNRPSLEVVAVMVLSSTAPELTYLAASETFLTLWRQLLHADDTYYNMVKNLVVARVFPGSVLSCIGTAFCPSLVLGGGDPGRQEVVMQFLLRTVLGQAAWVSDQCCLWLLERLLELDTALDLQAGRHELYAVTRALADKQLQEASKRSGLAQMFRLGSTFATLLSQLPAGEHLWVRGYVLEAQATVECELGLWPAFLYKLLATKKRERRTIAVAMADGCKHIKFALSFGHAGLAIVQAAQTLASCPPDHLGLVKIAAVFFARYLGLARLWDPSLAAHGSPGHRVFQEDSMLQILQQARAAIGAAKAHWAAQTDALQQQQQQTQAPQDADPGKLLQLQHLRDTLDMFLLWIDEPRLHLLDHPIHGFPQQYRADLLDQLRVGRLTTNDLGLPRRLLLLQARLGAAQWSSRHDLDLRFVRLAENALRKAPAPVATRLFQRFNRQTSLEALAEPASSLYAAPPIPPMAFLSSTRTLEFVGAPLSTMYQCAAKFKANRNFLLEVDRKYIVALSRSYEANTVSQTIQVPCGKAQHCLGPGAVDISYHTWAPRKDIATEIARNRLDYNHLVDEIVEFASLEQLVKAVVCLQNLVMNLGAHIARCKGDDELKKVVECGMALFFHIGRQINPETQSYPPHRHMVSSCMESLGLAFVQHAGSQAHKLLQGMLENELLVEIYGPHFNPNLDENTTAAMYSQVVGAHLEAKCPPETAFVILTKFDMAQFMEYCPRLAPRVGMVDAVCKAVGRLRAGDARDARIEGIHVGNLEALLGGNFARCLPTVLERFRALCQEARLGPQFWAVVARCVQADVQAHGELSLTTEEVKAELEAVGAWLSGLRFSQDAASACGRDGLFLRYGAHAVAMTEVCGLLLDAFLFKLCRSGRENIVSWDEVIRSGWDHVLKVYIPWLQAFPGPEGPDSPGVSLPWRPKDTEWADGMVQLVVAQLNAFVANILNEDSRGFLAHCVLIWVVNGLLVMRQLPSSPYHDTYCPAMKALRWEALLPSADCVKLILEFFSRAHNSEQSMALLVEVASKVRWSSAASSTVLEGLLFEMVVAMVCKMRTVFKVEATERLADELMEVAWGALTVADYGRGMEQLAANLEPRTILSNPSTIEGKVIRLLSHAVGRLGEGGGAGAQAVMAKQATYVGTVVKLLSVAFSFTQSRSAKGKPVCDDGQLSLFLLRVSSLLTEMETVVGQVADHGARHNLALSMLAEALSLFRNPAIAAHALEPVLGWVQESRASPLILPFLVATYRWPPHVPSMVRLAQELIEAYLLSDLSDGGPASWTTVTACARLAPELEQQYLRESVRHSCMLCLVQQVLLALPGVTEASTESWQHRIVEWLEEARPYGPLLEQGAVLLLFLYLQLLLQAAAFSARPGRSFDNMLQLLLKLSQSKKSSGLLGMVGMGKRSSFSFQFRVLCRALMVFLQAQLPTTGVFRTAAHQPGGFTGQSVTVTSRLPGEPLPSNKALQNLEWLKSQRQSKEMAASVKPVLESAIAFICEPGHSLMDATAFLRLLCGQLWPGERLLGLVLSAPVPAAAS